MTDELEKQARAFIAKNRPEPLKCMYCGLAQSFAPAAGSWLQFCPKAPKKEGHAYQIICTTADAAEEADAKRLASFAAQVREQSIADKICIEVGPKLFEFSTFNNWCDKARSRFVGSGHTMYTSICIDAKGRICMSGKEFMRADKEKTFPVSVYAIDPAAPPSTSQGQGE